MNGYDWTHWLMLMDFAMAAVLVLAGLMVVVAVVWELKARRLRRARLTREMDAELPAMVDAESQRISIPESGLTMADGDEEVEAFGDEPSVDRRQRR